MTIGLGNKLLADLRKEASRVAGELKETSAAILAGAVLDAVAVSGDNGVIDLKAYAELGNERLYIVAVNTSAEHVQPSFEVPTVMAANIELLSETRTLSHTDGSFIDVFAPYETHVYVLRVADVSFPVSPAGQAKGVGGEEANQSRAEEAYKKAEEIEKAPIRE